jgi:hypothetical protein
VLSAFLGTAFILAAVSKAAAHGASYAFVNRLPIPQRGRDLVSSALVLLEGLFGVALFAGWLGQFGLLAACAVFVGGALVTTHLVHTRSSSTCNCFGGWRERSNVVDIARNGSLVAVAVVAITAVNKPAQIDAAMVGSLASILVIVLFELAASTFAFWVGGQISRPNNSAGVWR